MPNYSITLNFFISKTIVNNFKEIEITEPLSFNWRKTEYCHCTVKAISLCDKVPEKEILDNWISKSQKILSSQKQFYVMIQDICNFPTTIYAHVHSDELLKLHKKLFTVLPSSQPQFENNNYIPHVSLCTVNQSIEINSNTKRNFGEFEVDEIQLLIWNLKELDNPQIYRRFNLMK